MVIEAVIFDWGGTLSEWEGDQALYDSWRSEGWEAAADALSPEAKELLTARLMAVEDEAWRASAETHSSAELSALIAEVAREERVEVTEAILEQAATRHLGSWRAKIRHDPDASRVLSELRRRGLRTGLLSNTYWPRDFHDAALHDDGLRDLLDERLYTSELAHTKPHPAVFLEVLSRLGVDDPSRAVFVGDRPFDDIYGANKAGLKTVLRPNTIVPAFNIEPDAVIHDLPSLLDVLDAWMGGLPA